MNSFYSAKWGNIFYYILTIQIIIKYPKYLTLVYNVIHNGSNNGGMHRSLKYCF